MEDIKRKRSESSSPTESHTSKKMASQAITFSKADLEECIKKIVADTFTTMLKPFMDDMKSLKKENEKLKADVIELKRTCHDLLSIETSIKRKNLILRGLPTKNDVHLAVEECFQGNMKINPGHYQLTSCRKIYERNGSMSVVTEFATDESVRRVLSNVRNLKGTKISIERDLGKVQRDKRKAMVNLRGQLSQLDKDIKTSVRNDQLRVGADWYYWDKDFNLKCNKEDGMVKLNGIFRNKLNLDLVNFEKLYNKQ